MGGSASANIALGSVALAVSPAIGGVLAANRLGVEGRGQLAVALACSSIAAIVGLRGIDIALLSVLPSIDLEQNEGAVLKALDQRVARVLVMEGPVAALVYMLVARSKFDLVLVVLVVALTACSCDFLLRRNLALAAGRTDLVVHTDLASAGIGLSAALLVFVLDGTLPQFLAASLVGLATASVLWRFRQRRKVDRPMSDLSPQEVRERLAPVARNAFLSRALLTTAFRADRLVLGLVAGPLPVGLYAAAIPLGESASLVPNHLAQLVTVRIARGDRSARWWRCREAQLAIGIVLFGGVVLAVFARQILSLLYGAEFEDGTNTLRLLALASVAGSVWRLAEAELFGRQRTRPAVTASLVAASIVIGITAALANTLGAAAAAVASLIAYVAAVSVVLVALRKERRR